MFIRPVRAVVIVSLVLATSITALAEAPRALPAGQLPADSRVGPLRTLDSYFPFKPVESPEAWKKRAAELRRQALVSNGLWPLPTRTPLEPVIHGKVERDGYTVEKVFFQSWPGHYVTGNLYRPTGKSGKLPAVLQPHGHWPGGRFHDAGEEATKKQVEIGAEKFLVGGRHPLQARCVQLARMGCVAFLYDMVGYADSVQLWPESMHRPGVRESMNTSENWGLWSPKSELWLQNQMGIQTWNSIRALDFLSSLPDVDPSRIGVSGASGGGTQTFMLVAVDDRPAVSFPVVMVSTAMQGGCTCENAPYLRIDAGNIDLAALAAPRPLGIVGANDWTKEIMTKGYPDLKQLYEMLGIPDRLLVVAFTQFDHNYNAVSRQQLFHFVNKHLGIGLSEPIEEQDYKPLTKEELSVWTAEHPAPSGEQVGESHERELLKWMTEDARKQIEALRPTDAKSMDEFRRVVGGGWDVMIGRRLEDVGEVEHELSQKVDKGTYLQMTSLLTRKDVGEQTPMLFLHPKTGWNEKVVVWVGEAGKSSLLDAQGAPIDPVAKLLSSGYSVASADLFLQGEFVSDPAKAGEGYTQHYGDGSQPWMKAGVYMFGYNHPLFARRVHDLLTVIKFIQNDERDAKQIHLVGLGATAGPLAAAARAQSGDAVTKLAVDTAGFRFGSLDRLNHPMFLPGAEKYGDVPALLALSAPHALFVAGEGNQGLAPAAYTAAGSENLTSAPPGDAAAGAVEWLMK